MDIRENVSLKNYHTFGIDVNTAYFAEYIQAEELEDFLKSSFYKNNQSLHIGGGSNLLFTHDYEGIILHSGLKSIRLVSETEHHVFLEADNGVIWDDFVDYCVQKSYYGAENLSLIPGEVGASAVQNIGAYGTEAKDIIHEVKAIEIKTGLKRIFSNSECKYGYRSSVFKHELKGHYIITSVIFKLSKTPSYKLDYQHLESEVSKLGIVNLKNIRTTIINIRNSKLPNPKETGNAGSFFMNPVVSKQLFETIQLQYPDMPHYFISNNEEKIPAGWLIEKCGWKGKSLGNAGVHDKQALVLINKGNASGNEIAVLASEIIKSVFEKFGITLSPEVIFVN